MSTRSCIARPIETGGFQGRYVHWDGYPSGVGRDVYDLFNRPVKKGGFGRNFTRLTKALLDNHPAGFSHIHGDWTASVGWGENKACAKQSASTDPVECYCHGERHDEPYEVTHENAAESGCEYAYVLYKRDGIPTMDVWTTISLTDKGEAKKMIGSFGSGDPSANWVIVGRVALTQPMNGNAWQKLDEVARNPTGLGQVVFF